MQLNSQLRTAWACGFYGSWLWVTLTCVSCWLCLTKSPLLEGGLVVKMVQKSFLLPCVCLCRCAQEGSVLYGHYWHSYSLWCKKESCPCCKNSKAWGKYLGWFSSSYSIYIHAFLFSALIQDSSVNLGKGEVDRNFFQVLMCSKNVQSNCYTWRTEWNSFFSCMHSFLTHKEL